MKKQRVIKTSAVTTSGDGKLSEIEIQFKLANDSDVGGYGTFFKDLSSKHIIRTYWEDLASEEAALRKMIERLDELENERKKIEKHFSDEKALGVEVLFEILSISRKLVEKVQDSLDNRIVAVEIGREMLLMILSQPRCEGVRFYQARGVDVKQNVNQSIYTIKNPGETTLVAVGMDQFGNDLDMKHKRGKKNTSIMNSKAQKKDDTMHSETNPPRKMIDLKGGNREADFNKIIENFESFK